VYSQSTRLTESFSTFCALERLLFRVDIAMVSKMILTSEGFATDITRIGTFVSVSSLVYQQVVRFCKLTVAEFANKLFL